MMLVPYSKTIASEVMWWMLIHWREDRFEADKALWTAFQK